MTPPVDPALVIVGLGATTSVGWDVATSAASIRAGLTRAGQVPGAEVLDEESHEMTPVIGHAVRGLTDGFLLYGRWFLLAQSAVADLLSSHRSRIEASPDFWKRAVLVIATRTPDEDVFLDEPDAVIDSVREMIGVALIEDLGLPIQTDQIEVVALGSVAGAEALRRAAARLGAGRDRALIVAVDALLDPIVLDAFASSGRLKESGNATGLMPGEAAVALLVEAETSDSPKPLAVVRGVTVRGPLREDDGDPVHLGTVAESFGDALDRAEIPVFEGDVYLDLNGEAWRSHQWGNALVAMQHRFAGEVQTPASSAGDVGAAMSLLGIGLACRSFARGYAHGSMAAILTMGEAGDSSCILLEGPRQGSA